jgi:hypothetical protein
MKPKPFSELNHLTTPVATTVSSTGTDDCPPRLRRTWPVFLHGDFSASWRRSVPRGTAAASV